MKAFKFVKLGLVLVSLIVLVLMGCEGPEPTVSPLAVPGGGGPAVVAGVQAEGVDLSAEVVAAVVAAAISVLLEVVPGLAKMWDGVAPEYKRLAWLVGCLAVPLVILGAGCVALDLGVVAPTCDKQGAVEALKVGFAAYFAGQATFAVVGQAVRRAWRQ